MNLSRYLTAFPILANAYTVLQGFAYGLLAIIAGTALAKFWAGGVSGERPSDTPMGVLLRTAIASAMISMGGYLLQLIVRLGTTGYEAIGAMQIQDSGFEFSSVASGVVQTFKTGIGDGAVSTLSDIGASMVSLIVLCLLGKNVISLWIEVAERYLMVGVLVFTSPIVYPTMASRDTSQIMRRWLSMFIGCVFQMSISILFLKLVLSGMVSMTSAGTTFTDTDGYGPLIQLILVLAMCKIAQRTDTYLQQLGIGVPTTGGNMLGDMLSMFHTVGSTIGAVRGGRSRGSGNGNGPILGAAPSGGRTAIGRAFSAYSNARNSGYSTSEAFSAAKQAASDKLNKGVGKAGKGLGEVAKGTGDAIANTARGVSAAAKGGSAAPYLQKAAQDMKRAGSGVAQAAGGAAHVVSSAVRPRTQAQRDNAQALHRAAIRAASKEAATATQATRAENRREFATGTSPMSDAVKNAVEKSGSVMNSSQAENNRARYGITNRGDAIIPMPKASGDDNSTPGLPTEAKAAGLSIEKNGNYVAGSHPNAVGDWLGHTTSKGAEASYNNGFAGAGTAGHVDPDESYKARAEKLAETYRTPEYAQETKAAREQANQAQEQVASLRSSGASSSRIQEAEANYKNLDQIASQREVNMERASRGNTGIDDIKQAIQASDRAAYYASYGEAQANARQAYDAYVTSAASYNELDRMKCELDASKQRYSEAKESGVSGSELAAMETDIGNQQSAINERWGEIREAEQHMKDPNFYRNYASQESESLQKADDEVYSKYADNAVANGSRESPEALREDAVKWSRETADLIANTIDRATPYEIDRALSNDSYEYGTTPLTVKMAQREFGAAIPDSASVVAFEAKNLKDTQNAEGDVVYGGRQYNIDYKDGDKYGRMLPYIKEQIQENQQQEQADSQQSQQNSQQSSPGGQQSSTSASGSQYGQNGMPRMSSQDIEKILNQLAQGASQGNAPQAPQMNNSSQKAQDMRNAERDGSKEQRSERQANGNDSAARDALERLAEAVANRQAENEVSQENLRQDSAVLNLASQTSSHANYGSKVVLPRAVNQDDIDTYNFMMKDLAAYSKRLQRQMLDILKDLREGTVSKHRAFGRKFDARDAYRPDQKFFMSKKNPTEIPDMSIFVLIDHSGSMRGERMNAAQKAAMLLYDFATNINILVAVAGHSDDCCVSFKLYTGFERASSTEKYRLAQMVPGGRNRDGMAINMASAMLEKRQEEIRMMIIISDGQPNSYAYSGEGAARDIREIIGKLRRKNIEVLAAGIGEDRERVKEIYGNDNYIDISDLSALPKILTNVVRKKVYAAM